MDVVGSVGYIGQKLFFVDNERFCYVTGKSICLYDTIKGPREMVWRSEFGIQQISVNGESRSMAIVSGVPSGHLEVVSLTDNSTRSTFWNPSVAGLMYITFSKLGDRIFCLTDLTDHKIIVWNISDESSLVVHRLDGVYQYCEVNPCDNNQFCLFGDNGLSVGVISEILGVHTTVLTRIEFEAVNDNGDDGEAPRLVHKINFALWLPRNRIIVGSSHGYIYDVRVDDFQSVFLGQFSVGTKRPEYLTPVSAALSNTSIIIGTTCGRLYWYPTMNLMSDASLEQPVLNLAAPQQVARVGNSAVCSLAVENACGVLLAGTAEGEIHKLQLQLSENSSDSATDEANRSDLFFSSLGEETGASVVRRLSEVQGLTLGSDTKSGITLCSKSVSIGVQKYSGRSRSSLTMLVTGSHTGLLNFWRHTAQIVEPMTAGGGIRRSAPRALKCVFDLSVGRGGELSQDNAICTLEFVPLPGRNSTLCCVGLVDGSVELWGLEAFEHEEEDVREEGGDDSGQPASNVVLVEDDEGACIVRVVFQRVFQSRVFHSAASLLSVLTSPSANDTRTVTLAIGSHSDHRVFLLPVMRSDILEACRITQFLQLEPHQSPQALVWSDDLFFVLCAGGAIHEFDSLNGHVPEPSGAGDISGIKWKAQYDSGIEMLTGAVLSPTSSDLLIVLSNSNSIYAFPVRAIVGGFDSEGHGEGRLTGGSGVGYKSFSLSDVPICVGFSPNGRFFATGGLDGSLHVWRVDGEDCCISLANKMQMHGGAVVSLSFSSCSSLLLTCAADGSCFVVTLDKPTAARTLALLSTTKSNLFQESEPSGISALVASTENELDSGSSTWLELKGQESVRELRAQQKFKSMGIAAAVGEITHRLAVLIGQNGERSEIEQLPRSAFVIDVRRKEALQRSHDELVRATKGLYHQRSLYNEAVASRARTDCWDTLESAVGSVLPFSCSPDADERRVAVSSYAVHRLGASAETLLSRIKRLRSIEIRAQRASAMGSVHRVPGHSCYRIGWNASLRACPSSVSWLANDGVRWPVYDNLDAFFGAAADSGKDKQAAVAAHTAAGPDDDDDMSVQSTDEDREVDENSVLNLLYAPQCVRTHVQKRNQIILLREVVRSIKIKFNERWTQVFREKEDIIGAIESRNVRIRAILEDLRVTEETVFSPRLKNLEVSGSHIQVADEEMSSGRYESPAVLSQRLREEEERLRRERELDGEDVKGRALQEMMHGTLEVKRDVFAEASALVKPEWMDTLAVSEMNESQLREFDVYQQKLKALQEEQTVYRKALEQEIKKLRSEIADICKSFDERLDDLARLKVLVHREILSHELYVARLGLNMAHHEHNRAVFGRTEEQLASLRQERAKVRSNLDRLNTRADEMRQRIAAADEECRQMDKGFKRDLQNLCGATFDQDKLKVFTQLYRQRLYPRGYYDASATGDQFGEQSEADVSVSQKRGGRSSSKGGKQGRSQKRHGLSGSNANEATKNRAKMRASKGVSTGNNAGRGDSSSLGPMQQAAQALKSLEEAADKSAREKDPFYEALQLEEKRRTLLEAQMPLLAPLNMEMDCPEGFDVDQFCWSKLQELRTARIEREIEGKQLASEFAELKQKQDMAELAEQAVRRSIVDLKAVRQSVAASSAVLASDLDLVVCVRQGQDEVDRDAVVTDYSDSLILPVQVISKYNLRIKELGRDKIGILSKIKQFRRKINSIDWEASHTGLEADHYECYLTDLQLFRVTRELQKIIRDVEDGADTAKDKSDRVVVRKEFLQKDRDAKLQQLRRVNDSIVRQLEDRNSECSTLADKISCLKNTVASSKSVKQSRDDSRGGAGELSNAATLKMKKVVGRRRLVDTARAQAEEIDFLRQELDRMRQRTFPSFVRSTRKRVAVHPPQGF